MVSPVTTKTRERVAVKVYDMSHEQYHAWLTKVTKMKKKGKK